MKKGVTITALQLENVKRVRAVRIVPQPDGLTIIGGKNRQGKTSILDAICYALGGEKYRPTNLQHEGGLADARIEIKLSNGLLVERKGKNATLKVTDPSGQKSGQKVLDSFVEELALNLPRFMAMGEEDKAISLLNTLGIGDQLAAIDREEQKIYDKRHAQGVITDQKTKYWREMPEHHDCPETPMSASDLVSQAQAVMQRNADRGRARAEIESLEEDFTDAQSEVTRLSAELAAAKEKEAKLSGKLMAARAKKIPADESTAEIQVQIDDMEAINAKVRANMDKAKAKEDAEFHQAEYDKLTMALEAVREKRRTLLDGCKMPIVGLGVGKNDRGRPVLTFDGKAWDCMSGVEQFRVAVSIAHKLNPACGFVLLDELEKFDLGELAEFASWLEDLGLQAIATRVSEGKECSVIIEDGVVRGQEIAEPTGVEEEKPTEEGW